MSTATGGEHPLNTGFTLYLMRRQKHTRKQQQPGQQKKPAGSGEHPEEDDHQHPQQQVDSSVEDYEKAIKRIASFNTVEGFWRIYGHLSRPNEVAHSTDLHMFREGIKPVWEDAANRRGGKLVIKVKKGLGARYWESLLLAVIGEQFGELQHEVCGVVISVRHNEDVLSLWTRNSDNNEALHKMREILKKSLKLPGFVPIDYKRHDTAAAVDAPSAAATSSSSASTPQKPSAWRGTAAATTTTAPMASTTGGPKPLVQPADWRS